jgi:hypothetical protein
MQGNTECQSFPMVSNDSQFLSISAKGRIVKLLISRSLVRIQQGSPILQIEQYVDQPLGEGVGMARSFRADL